MKFPYFISARQYFIGIFILGSFMFAAFSGVLYKQYSEAQRTQEWTLKYYETLRGVRVILINLLNMETGVRGYELNADERFLEPYYMGLSNINRELPAFAKQFEEAQILPIDRSTVLSEIRAFETLLQSQVELVKKSGASAITKNMSEAQKQKMDHLRERMEDILDSGALNLRTQLDKSHEKEHQFISLLVTGTILAIGSMFLATTIILSLMSREKRAEEQAQETEERFLTVMNGINDGLYDYNINTGSIYYSPAYKQMLGYKDNEHANTLAAFRRAINPEDVPLVFKSFRDYSEGRMPIYSCVFRLRHKDGSWRWILSRGVGLWKNKRLIRMIGTHTDITEQKKREDVLQQLNEDLENFTYIASHDLRSPLVNLKGFASEVELSLRQVTPMIKNMPASEQEKKTLDRVFDQEVPEALTFIKNAVERMDLLTSAVLDLSRIGKRELRMDTIDTQALVDRYLKSQAYEINVKNIDIVYGNLPELVSDRVAIEQVFGNLIDNAIKYLKPGKPGKIIISAQHAGADIIFSVADNGRGIADNDKNKVFEIFRRARNTGDARGIGMGLSYVKATLRKLGGSIWFESELDSGTIFYFKVPAHYKIQPKTSIREKTA